MFECREEILEFDGELWDAMEAEARRQENHLELIASENYVSKRVLSAVGSVLTNKYAEGYPGRRYYGGCEHVDVVEELAIRRAKELFVADYANVQPHSGSQANTAVYLALLKPGDTILGMGMAHGGHLTHGAKVSSSGKIYNAVQYGVCQDTGELDYQQIAELAERHRPRMIVAGFSAYSRVIEWQRLRDIADVVGAYLMVDIAHVSGLIPAGLYPNPVPLADVVTATTHKTLRGPRGGLILARANSEIETALDKAVFPGGQGGPLMHVIAGKAVAFHEALQPDFTEYQVKVVENSRAMASVLLDRGYDVVSGGTDNHLVLVDLVSHGLTGRRAERALECANITVNRNAVPNDPKPPLVTSGLRIGTPAATTRGMGAEELTDVALWICDILDDTRDRGVIEKVKAKVKDLCASHPVYRDGSTAPSMETGALPTSAERKIERALIERVRKAKGKAKEAKVTVLTF